MLNASIGIGFLMRLNSKFYDVLPLRTTCTCKALHGRLSESMEGCRIAVPATLAALCSRGASRGREAGHPALSLPTLCARAPQQPCSLCLFASDARRLFTTLGVIGDALPASDCQPGAEGIVTHQVARELVEENIRVAENAHNGAVIEFGLLAINNDEVVFVRHRREWVLRCARPVVRSEFVVAAPGSKATPAECHELVRGGYQHGGAK